MFKRLYIAICFIICSTLAFGQRNNMVGNTTDIYTYKGGTAMSNYFQLPNGYYPLSFDSCRMLWVTDGSVYYHDCIGQVQLLSLKDSDLIKSWISDAGSNITPGLPLNSFQYDSSGVLAGSNYLAQEGRNIHVKGRFTADDTAYLRGGLIYLGVAGSNLGFYGTSPIGKPSGSIKSALSAFGMITSPTIPVTDISASGTATSTTYLRGDGTWATPSTGVVSVVGTSGQINVSGTSTVTASLPNVGTAGTYGDATHFVGITTDAQGRVSGVSTYTVPSTGGGTGVNSLVATGPLSASGTSTVTLSLSGTVAVGNGGTGATTTTSVNTTPITYGSNNTITAAPSGSAGGSLSGSYPNPSIASNVSLPGGPTTTTQAVGDNSTRIATTGFTQSAINATSVNTLPLAAGSNTTITAAPSGTAGGDLTGTYPSPVLRAVGTSGTYGDAAHYPVVTTNTKGQVTSITTVAAVTSVVSNASTFSFTPTPATGVYSLVATGNGSGFVKNDGTSGVAVSSVVVTGVMTATGTSTVTVGMPAATASNGGYLTSGDWNTFNNKGNGTVTSVGLVGSSTMSVTGTASPITSSGTFTLSVPASSIGTVNLSATGTPSASTYLRGDNTWATPSGAGTVTSIKVVSNLTCFTVTPTTAVTSSGVYSLVSTGTSSQFVKGDGSLDNNTYLTSAVTSIKVVSNAGAYSFTPTSAVTSSGTYSMVATGTSSQFVKGDGSLSTIATGDLPATTVYSVVGTANQITATGTNTVTVALANNTAIPGSPTTTTQSAGDNSNKVATTGYVDQIGPQLNTAASYSVSTTPTSTVADARSVVYWDVTAQATALLFNAPTGSWANHQLLCIRIKDNGTARALTYNSIYRAGTTVSYPTTTTISKTIYLLLSYNTADTKFDLLAYTDGY